MTYIYKYKLTQAHKTNNYFHVLFVVCSLLFTTVTVAHNLVVVVPMAGDDLKPLKNIVTVAKENGDFTSPIAAMSSITDATSTNPYLIVIAPGIYSFSSLLFGVGDAQLVMKKFVDITGSGQNVTILTSARSSASPSASAAVVVGANNASIRDLTIKNVVGTLSTAANAIGIFNDGASPTISDITISVEANRNFQYGVRNLNTVANGAASPILSDITILVTGGTSSQSGVFNATLVAAIRKGVTISNAKITVEGASGTRYGVYNNSASDYASIRNSIISAATASVRAFTGTGVDETYISDSLLTGAVTGNPKCNFVFTSAGAELNSGCQ